MPNSRQEVLQGTSCGAIAGPPDSWTTIPRRCTAGCAPLRSICVLRLWCHCSVSVGFRCDRAGPPTPPPTAVAASRSTSLANHHRAPMGLIHIESKPRHQRPAPVRLAAHRPPIGATCQRHSAGGDCSFVPRQTLRRPLRSPADPRPLNITPLTGLKVCGSRVTNIVGNGRTVSYDPSSNGDLTGKTYLLTGGGTLQPA